MHIDIRLEKFTERDYDYFFQLVHDENVMEKITERAMDNDKALADFESRMENNRKHKSFGHFKIIDDTKDEFLGSAKLEIQDTDSREAELGYMLLPPHWGKGIGGTVAKQLVDVAKEKRAVDALFAIIDPDNIPSRRILTNNGFVFKEFKDVDGLWREILELKL